MEKNTELLNTQTSAEETDKQNSGELITRWKVENTPFTMVWEDGKGWMLAMGEYRVTEYYKTDDELETILKEKNWDFLTTVIAIIIEQTNKIK